MRNIQLMPLIHLLYDYRLGQGRILIRNKSTDFSRWWGVGAKAPHHIHSTNEVGGYKNEVFLGTIDLSRKTQLLGQVNRKEISSRDQRHQEINPEATDEVGGHSSNLQVIDEAFEYLVSKSSKGEKGQYFTPRHVIDMCVKMLNPQRGEYMIDTAAGSCGFTVHTIFQITGHLFENTEISAEEKDDVLKVFGIDFDEKVVRVARTLNLIAGDGETNVLHLNTLDYDRWNEKVNNPDWRDTYSSGFRRLEVLKKDRNSNKEFLFCRRSREWGQK